MPYKKLIRMYSERKTRLNELLNDDTLDLKKERMHSIKGAVDEIELFLHVLNEHQAIASGMDEEHHGDVIVLNAVV